MSTKTKIKNAFYLIGIMIVCVGGLIIFMFIKKGYDLANEAPFSNPTLPFNESNLVGNWIIKYSGSREEVIQINHNRQYRQVYIEDGRTIESQDNDWWIEQLADGRIYLHLEGAKYYFYGVSAANEPEIPCPPDDLTCKEIANQIHSESYDWIGNEWVDVTDQLVLNVRMNSSNELILLHLWKSSDRGFPIIGGESEIYRKENSNYKD